MTGDELDAESVERLNRELPSVTPGYDFRWLPVLKAGLQQSPYCIVAVRNEQVVGALPLMFVNSALFGKHLIGMPYVNVGGIRSDDVATSTLLIDRAVELADQLDVHQLQLRHESEFMHSAFNNSLKTKVHLRLALPQSVDALRSSFKSKLRSQIRKSETGGLTVHWGHEDLLGDFYNVFARNMRDLGTPVFGRPLFQNILKHFGQDAEICVVRDGLKPAAAALLIHGKGATEVPSASTIREYNKLNANMLMYWQLLQRAVERRQAVFDFGRSTADSNTFRFKRQWGALPSASCWQYYIRKGNANDLRPENESFAWKIQVWKKLPVWFTRLIGPAIVRGIP